MVYDKIETHALLKNITHLLKNITYNCYTLAYVMNHKLFICKLINNWDKT